VAIATLTSKSQLTLPREVRLALGVGPGDRITFVRMDDGNFALMPAALPATRLEGLLAKPRKPVSLEEMDKAIVSGARGV